MRRAPHIVAGVVLAAGAAGMVQAADWSDTSLGYRTGRRFAEPFNANDIRKHIVQLSHASGYKYGSNFANLDVLLSDKTDPSSKGATSAPRSSTWSTATRSSGARSAARRCASAPCATPA